MIAHLIEHHLRDTPRLDEATRRALRELRGSYAIVVLAKSAPDRLVAAKHGAGSVVVGLGAGETFLASDIPALLAHTRDMVILEDEDIAVVTRHGVEVTKLDGAPAERQPTRILWDPILAGEGRLPPLHAEGDLRAAARRRRHPARARLARERQRGAARHQPRSRDHLRV